MSDLERKIEEIAKRPKPRNYVPPPPTPDPFWDSKKSAYDAEWILQRTKAYLKARREAEILRDEIDAFAASHSHPLVSTIKNRLIADFEKDLAEERRRKKPPSKKGKGKKAVAGREPPAESRMEE